jgi:hypothetical protein
MTAQNKSEIPPTPAANAERNAEIAAAVKEAVAGVMAALAPALQAANNNDALISALREVNKPYKDPKQEARELRESLKWKEDEKENRRLTEERQSNCPHLDKNGRTSICLVHNHPDRNPRGICVICHSWINPKEWRIASTPEIALQMVGGNKDRVKGCAYLVDEHPQYKMVRLLESTS